MKLKKLYLSLTVTERKALAKKAGTTHVYLWQVACHWRGKRPSLDLIKKLVKADDRLSIVDLVEEYAK